MAERRPLVVVAGVVQELPTGDSVPGGASLPPGTVVGQVPTWDGDSWEPTLPPPKITVSSTEPSDPSVGDIWISF